MVKTAEQVREKMQDRISTAGKYLKAGMESAEDPIDKLLKDPAGNAKKLQDGINESIRTGKYAEGLRKAKDRGSWAKSHDRAAAHFEERSQDLVDHAMESYDKRATAIANAKAAIEGMPKATFAQRQARLNKYQAVIHTEMSKAFGRKE